MADGDSKEAALALVGKVDGLLDKQKFRGDFAMPADPKSTDIGEWEYVLVARLPSMDLQRPGAAPLDVTFEGEMVRVDLMIDPDSPEAHDALVMLVGADGYSKTLSVLEQGKLHAHAKGMTAVVFDGLKLGVKYTCAVQPGNDGAPYNVFQNVELKEDHILKAEEKAKAKTEMKK